MAIKDAAEGVIVSIRFWLDILAYTLIVALLDLYSFATTFLRHSQSLNSVNVAAQTAPTFFATFFRHMVMKGNRKGKATQQLSYEEGLMLVKHFLELAATHTVEEIQSFTGKETPTPSWIEKTVVEIPEESLEAAAEFVKIQLEKDDPGLKDVGGAKWWTLRARPLFAEWVELLRDASKREALGKVGEEPPQRVILYLHGGAHYFAGNGTHRYQIQRHARKLSARAFSVSFRLSPQYPFPCSLHDALAAYLYLIAPPVDSGVKPIPPSQIMLYGDSSGGGLALSLMVLLRDAKLPLPAGGVLFSPWVDLTHSFPSVMGDPSGDYIPEHGFHYRPSLAWPPLRGDPMVFKSGKKELVVKDQIQLYCANAMVAHPLVSLVNQGSLGGLPPLLFLGGASELLADEIIYIAHKAANPKNYPPAEELLDSYPYQRHKVEQYPPTKVHLQMFDSCCHVTTTLSFSEPAKYQYRSAANFSLWALKAASIHEEHNRQKEFDEIEETQSHFDFATNQEARAPPQNFSPPKYRKSFAKHIERKESNSNGQPVNHSQRASDQSSPSKDKPLNGAVKHDDESEVSVLTDEEAALANEHNEDASDYTEDSESSEEDSEDLQEDVPDGVFHKEAKGRRMPSLTQSAAERHSDTAILDGERTDEHLKRPDDRVISVTGTEPVFSDSIIRERITPDGRIRDMEPEKDVIALQVPRSAVGRITPDGPIRRWLEKRKEWDRRYTRELVYYRKMKMKDRKKAEKGGYLSRQFFDENPPLSAVAGMWDQKLAWEAVRGQDSSTSQDGQREEAGLGLLLWSKLSAKPDAEQEGKKALDDIAANGERKLKRKPSSIKSSEIEEIEQDISFD